MLNKNRVVYQKEYRDKYGDLMQEQIKVWFKQHPNYLKEWRKSHPAYFKEYRKQNQERLRVYWRVYKQKKRVHYVHKKKQFIDISQI
jgi:ABC-type metal ion transport system substrate-binding protein